MGRVRLRGQCPLAVPEEDLIVVINQWNILVGQPSLPAMPTLARILNGVTDRSR